MAGSEPSLRWTTVNLDCGNAVEMAGFYCRLLGWRISYRDDDDTFIIIAGPDEGVRLSFQQEPHYRPPAWPEQVGSQDKMMHLEILVDDLEGAVAHAIACGARLNAFQGREDLRVMLDPSGHPFCLFTD